VTRERRLWLLAAAAVLATVVVVAAIAISQGGADDDEEAAAPSPAPAQTEGEAPAQSEGEAGASLLEGVPQRGAALGDPDAPATLIEFADLQCPFCAEFAIGELPQIVDDQVRPGRLRLELRLLAFIGPDSQRGRQVAHAAALQNRMWDYTDLFFRNQGPENSGYATNAFLEQLARQTPGLDTDRLAEDFSNPKAEALTRQAERLGRQLQVEGTPSFYLVRSGGPPEPVEIDNLEEALGGG
jgi:protein-disulfide isomerase